MSHSSIWALVIILGVFGKPHVGHCVKKTNFCIPFFYSIQPKSLNEQNFLTRFGFSLGAFKPSDQQKAYLVRIVGQKSKAYGLNPKKKIFIEFNIHENKFKKEQEYILETNYIYNKQEFKDLNIKAYQTIKNAWYRVENIFSLQQIPENIQEEEEEHSNPNVHTLEKPVRSPATLCSKVDEKIPGLEGYQKIKPVVLIFAPSSVNKDLEKQEL